jgi:hypothetical protein
MGETIWLRLTEQWTATAKSVFLFDVQGSVAKSTFAGLPWLLYLRSWCKRPIHFWPFDGWGGSSGQVGRRGGLPGTMSGCPVVSVLEASHCTRLLTFLPLDNVELDFVTFFERFIPVRLNR